MIPIFLAAASALPAPRATSFALDFANPSRSPLALKAPWLTHTFAGIFVLAAVLLIALLAVQTTKQEGLSGTIGGKVESAYRSRLGADQQIARLTGIVAVTFVVVATILSISGI